MSSTNLPDSEPRNQSSESVFNRKSSSSKPPTLIERIKSLDRSSDLAHLYTAFVILDTPSTDSDCNGADGGGTSPSYVPVGHVETSLIHSALLHCKNDEGDPIFILDKLPNKNGDQKDVLRLTMDLQLERHLKSQTQKIQVNNDLNDQLFEQRTKALGHVTDHLLSAGIITFKHLDVYPVSVFSFGGSESKTNDNNQSIVRALINRSTAPYLGIDSVGVHLHCYVTRQNNHDKSEQPNIEGVWLAKRAPTKSHHPNYWDPTVAGGQPAELSLYENIIKEGHEEAGVPSEWISNKTRSKDIKFSDHTHDPLTITTAKPDGSCMKRSLYYSFDLEVPHGWTPTPIDGEVSEFKLYSMEELEEELVIGNSVRPAMRAVLLDFMMRHGELTSITDNERLCELRHAMRRDRLHLW